MQYCRPLSGFYYLCDGDGRDILCRIGFRYGEDGGGDVTYRVQLRHGL